MTKEKFNIKLGAFVKQKRVSRNWSQETLADKMNNNYQNISRIERGLTSPTYFWISKLAEAFEQDIASFSKEFQEYK